MSISVAVCTYNGEKYIEQQMNSIINQTMKVDEIIVCDDGSTDNTISILNSIKNNTDIKVVIIQNKHNLGVSNNFNNCIRKCFGDYIFFADQDDIWKVNKVEFFINRFNETKSLLLYSNAIIIDQDNNEKGYNLISENKNKILFDQNKSFFEILKVNFVTGATMAIDKNVLKFFSNIPQYWIQDEWIASLVYFIGECNYIYDSLICYRIHPNNQVGLFDNKIKSRFSRYIKNIEEAKEIRLFNYKKYLSLKECIENIDEKFVDIDRLNHLINKLDFLNNEFNIIDSKFKDKISIIRRNIQYNYYSTHSSGANALLKDLIILFK